MADRPDVEGIRARYRIDQEDRVDMGHLLRWVTDLEADSARLAAALAGARKALEFYAAERHYDEETGAVGKLIRIPSTPDQAPGEFFFEADWGETARAALTNLPGEEAGAPGALSKRELVLRSMPNVLRDLPCALRCRGGHDAQCPTATLISQIEDILATTGDTLC